MDIKSSLAALTIVGMITVGCSGYDVLFRRGAANYAHGRLGEQATFSVKKDPQPFCSDGACHPYSKFSSWGNKDKSRLNECLLTQEQRQAYRADSLEITWLSPDDVELKRK